MTGDFLTLLLVGAAAGALLMGWPDLGRRCLQLGSGCKFCLLLKLLP